MLRTTTPQICIYSQSTAKARNLRLRRSHIHRRGTDNGRVATVNAEYLTGRTALRTDVGDAQWVGCDDES